MKSPFLAILFLIALSTAVFANHDLFGSAGYGAYADARYGSSGPNFNNAFDNFYHERVIRNSVSVDNIIVK